MYGLAYGAIQEVNITEGLIAADPKNEASYRKNSGVKKLENLKIVCMRL